MKKLLLTLTLLASALFASNGATVYQNKCVSCHKMQGMMDMSQMKTMKEKMQSASKEEKQKLKVEMQEKMKKSGMRAPAMNMVSMRLKMMTKDKESFITFVKDYIQNPSQEKGYCMPMAYKRFGTMPPIGKSLTEAERASVANWLYENFKGSWGDSKDAKMCNANNKHKKASMKCGANR